MNRREFLETAAAATAGLALTNSPVTGVAAQAAPAADSAGELLYNGIRLPAAWPPKIADVPAEPVVPPYLSAPPAAIPIDVGRQLFVDDFLIDSTTLTRTNHSVEFHPANPILKPEKTWEREGRGAMAMVFSDGVWFDPADKLFKMWYMGGYGRCTCLAVSQDGIKWERPDFDVRRGTNIVQAGPRDSTTVWLDHNAADPKRRYWLFRSVSGGSTVKGSFGLATHHSADGLHWSEPALLSGSCGDRSTVFYNPFRKVWVYSLRHGWGQPRRRRYFETRDIVDGPKWEQIGEPRMWCGADKLDPIREDLKIPCQLYNLDAVAYESVLLGLFSIWRGDLNIPAGRPKPNEVCAGFSRDGWHWHRPQRKAFIPVSEKEGDWNWGNVQSAGGCCLVVGDRLHFYFSGRAGSPQMGNTRDTGGATGLAFLRRDGFASMDAGEVEGTLTTRPLTFTGKRLFVNAAAKGGALRAEVLDAQGKPTAPFTKDNCAVVGDDRTRAAVNWKGADHLAAVAGKPVRFRFHLRGGRLYSFWVSPDAAGASRGYVAAGGPGFAGAADSAGG